MAEVCADGFIRWDGTCWTCQLERGHYGDHYAEAGHGWSFWAGDTGRSEG